MLREARVSRPSVGEDWSVVLDWDHWTLPLSIYGVLVASAVTANRFPIMQAVSRSGDVLWAVEPTTYQTASKTLQWCWAQRFPLQTGTAIGAEDLQNMGLPLAPLPPGTKLETDTLHLDAGDQWSQVALVVQYDAW